MNTYNYDLEHCAKCGKKITSGMSFVTKTDVVNHQIQSVKYCTGCAMLYIDGGILRGEYIPPKERVPMSQVGELDGDIGE